MSISVIIPVYNREHFIQECVKSVLKQNTSRDYEVILVDDGSKDRTREIMAAWASHPRVKILNNDKNQGTSYAKNRGIAESKGKYLAFTDSDCIVDTYWLEELTKPFDSDPKIMITGGCIVEPEPQTYWETVNKGCYFLGPKNKDVSYIIGCNMAFRREFLLNHLFDNALRFPGGEERELCLICLKLGNRVYYTVQAKVNHYHRADFRATVRQSFRFGYGNAYALLKQGYSPFRAPGLPLVILLLIFLVIFASRQLPLLWPVFPLMVPIIFSALIAKLYICGHPKTVWEEFISFPGYVIKHFTHIIGKLFFLADHFILKKAK